MSRIAPEPPDPALRALEIASQRWLLCARAVSFVSTAALAMGVVYALFSA